MITRKTANSAITKAITGVVPHPGVTFPYSEFNGFNKVPNVVTNPLFTLFCFIFAGLFEVVIKNINEYH
jgi:hypothetical protein